jgi:broad specificity phosphatase PhoE
MDPATRQPLVNEYWSRMDPTYRDGDGAESFGEFWDRAHAFLVDAAGRSGFGLVFTHEQFIRAVLMAVRDPGAEPSAGLMREFLEMRRELPIANGEVVRLRWKGGRWWVGGFSTFRLQESSRARLASRGQLRRCSRSGDSTA